MNLTKEESNALNREVKSCLVVALGLAEWTADSLHACGIVSNLHILKINLSWGL